jgi:DNA-binding transcriptional MerR regulator
VRAGLAFRETGSKKEGQGGVRGTVRRLGAGRCPVRRAGLAFRETGSKKEEQGGESVTELLSIGEFAKVSRLSIKALRLYDSLELLIPEEIDRVSGYRYYTVAAGPSGRAIALLRSLDMPLIAIKEVLAESDPDKVRSHLARHRAVLADRLEAHERMNGWST